MMMMMMIIIIIIIIIIVRYSVVTLARPTSELARSGHQLWTAAKTCRTVAEIGRSSSPAALLEGSN